MLLSNVPAETVDSAVSSLKNSKFFSYRYMKDRVEVKKWIDNYNYKTFKEKRTFRLELTLNAALLDSVEKI